ncbi:MAG: tetratricopeptide repeat protein [Myxococcales bacterium]|nr:tetratricopeptide repeat protein [Myxococcales bacterium]
MRERSMPPDQIVYDAPARTPFLLMLWCALPFVLNIPTAHAAPPNKETKTTKLAKIGHPEIKDAQDQAITELLADKKTDKAISLLQILTKNQKTRTPLRVFLLGRALFQKKRYNEAAKHFFEVSKIAEKSNFFKEKALMLTAESYALARSFPQAQKIYGDAVKRFLSPKHREKLASIYLRYAEKYLREGKERPAQKATYQRKAATFFKRALDLDLPQGKAQEIRLKLGRVYLQLRDHEAAQVFKEARKIEKKGKLAAKFLFFLAKSLEQQSNYSRARSLWQDFIQTYPKSKHTPQAYLGLAENYLRQARYHKRSLDLGIEALQELTKKFPAHKLTRKALFRIGQAYFNNLRYKEGQQAYQAFVQRFAKAPVPEGDRSLAEAHYFIAESSIRQNKPEASIQQFSVFLQEHPTDSLWPEAQKQIILARFRIAQNAHKKKKYAQAKVHYEDFLKRYPLDYRAEEVMWNLANIEEQQKRWQASIQALSRLVSKYPSSRWGRQAAFHIGEIYEKHLKNYEKAIKSYEKVRYWRFRYQAQNAVRRLKRKELTLFTPRVFNTKEGGHLRAEIRNIKKLSVKMYAVDAETYFRKMNRFGGMNTLDIELIRPDKEWEVQLKSPRYELTKQKIALPGKLPMVALFQIAGGGLQATTVVIRSNLQIITKLNRETIFVFAFDSLTLKPLAGARLIVSNGSKILYEAQTGADGTYRLRDAKLRLHKDLHILAEHKGSIASSRSNLSRTPYSSSLSHAGIIYTDRPLYLPGDRVELKAILREVHNNQYKVPTEAYTLTISNSHSQEIFRETLRPNALGTLTTSFQSDPSATVGDYVVRLYRKQGPTFTGNFEIQQYTLPRYLLQIQSKRKVYVRGEKIRGLIIARYGFGAPAAGKLIRFSFAGRSYKGKTDARGRFAFDLPTRELDVDRSYTLSAELQGESTHIKEPFWLQSSLFSIHLATMRKVYAAGESFHVSLHAHDSAKKNYAANVKLTWAMVGKDGEKQLGSAMISLGKDGKGKHTLVIPTGGKILLRAQTKDSLGHPVSGEHNIYISGQEDKQILRLLSDRDRYYVGETIQVRLLSRRSGPALFTWESNGVYSHQFIPHLQKGERLIKFEAKDSMGLNFAFNVTLLDGAKMHATHTVFALKRFLKVTIKPRKKAYAPNESAEIEILTTDQSGKPVAAELSVAMVDELLLSIAKDKTPELEKVFYKYLRRLGMVTQASSTFRYSAYSKKIPKTLRLMYENGDANQPSTTTMLPQAQSRGYGSYQRYRRKVRFQRRYNKQLYGNGGGGNYRRRTAINFEDTTIQGELVKPEGSNYVAAPTTGFDGVVIDNQIRKRFAATAFWRAALRTDEKGRLVLKVPLPENTTTWRIIARGVAKPLLVGQGEGRLVVRKEIFGELKLPEVLVEGDRFQPRAVVHNQSQRDVKLIATLNIVSLRQIKTVKLSLKPGQSEEIFFGEFATDGAGDKDIQVLLGIQAQPVGKSKKKQRLDASMRYVRVVPKGVEITAGAAGILKERETHTLKLPSQGPFRHTTLRIRLGMHTPTWLLRVAEQQKATSGIPGLLLLRAASLAAGIRYLESQQLSDSPQSKRFRQQLSQLFRALLPRQYSNGGWGFAKGSASSLFSTIAYATMYEASKKKWVNFSLKQSLQQTKNYLNNTALPNAEQDEEKLFILYGLAHGNNDASPLFTYINQYLRKRTTLSARSLATLALLLVKLQRNDLCEQLVPSISAKIRAAQKKKSSVSLFDLALSIEALALISPSSPALEQGVRWLLAKRRGGAWHSMFTTTQAIRALFAYYQHFPIQDKPTRVGIYIQGKLWKEVTLSKAQPVISLARYNLPAQRDIKVTLAPQGNGKLHYVAVLSAFTTHPSAALYKGRYRIRRYVEATPLQVEGKTIRRGFSILRKGSYKSWRQVISELRWADSAKVSIQVYRRSGENEEMVVEESLPGGVYVQPSSISMSPGGYYNIERGKIRFFLHPSGNRYQTIRYRISGLHPGSYHYGYTRAYRFAAPQDLSLGRPSNLSILRPGLRPQQQRKLSPDERYTLGIIHFNAGRIEKAEELLRPLLEKYNLRSYALKHVALSLLTIALKRGPNHALIKSFEILKERFPETELSFAQIMSVGQAYASQGEHERAFMVFQATLVALFLQELKVAKALEEEGEFAAASSFIESLWRRYPDLRTAQETFYALAQSVYQHAEKCKSKPRKEQEHWLKEAARLFKRFVWMHPTHPSVDIAAYSYANVLMELEKRSTAIAYLKRIAARYPKSARLASVHYLQAYAHYLETQYDPALRLLLRVSKEKYPDGQGGLQKSVDRFLARYLIAQIYHAQQKYKESLVWYKKIRKNFPDADAQVRYLSQIQLRLPEVTTIAPHEKPLLKLKHQNIEETTVLAYYVDLMKLYLLKKDLSAVTRINLAGIRPSFQKKLKLGSNEEFALRTTSLELPLKRLGAYLVVLKSKNREVSGIVMRSSLRLQVQQDQQDGRVTLHLQRAPSHKPVSKALTRIVGSADGKIRSGRTDLRGIFTVEDVHGLATIIAQAGDEYAFHRGKLYLKKPVPHQEPARPSSKNYNFDALENINSGNKMLQRKGRFKLEKFYRNEQRGVQLNF